MVKLYRFITIFIVVLTLTLSARPTQAAGMVTNCAIADLTAALTGGGVVDFNIGADCIFYFTSRFTITANTTIQNTSAHNVTLSSPFKLNVPILGVSGVTVNISNVTFFQGGSNTNSGGAIYNDGGTLIINNTIFNDNFAASGGAIANTGIVNISNSTFTSNSAITGGGAIYNDGGTVTVNRSAFYDNSAGSGAGINNWFSGVLTVNNSTFSANTPGGAVYSVGNNAILTHNTFSGNVSFINPANVYNGGGSMTITASLFNGGSCGGTFTDGGNNIAYNATDCLGANINPALGAFSGGVHIPANGAIEYAPACALSTDQLGTARPQGALCTPGAVEVNPPPQSVTVQFASATGNALETASTGALIRVTTSDTLPVGVGASVQIGVTGGSATNGTDYNLVSSTISIPMGTAHNATISIDPNLTIVNDAIDESNETIDLALSAPSGASIGAQSTYSHTIVDDDTVGIILTNTAFTISEPNGANQFRVLLNSQPTANVTLNMTVSDASECQLDVPSITFTDADWFNQQLVTVTAVNDSLVDGAQPCDIGFTVISGDGLYTRLILSFVNVTVNDDDVPSAILIISGDAQQTAINTAFPIPIVIQVNDAGGQPLEGATVTFTPPAIGASAILSTTTGITDVNGQVTITADANGDFGAYPVLVESGALTPVNINLENLDPDVLDVTAVCVGNNLEITINAGAPNFDITGIRGTDLPQMNIPLGTYTLTGPDTWVGVTIAELTGDLETITLPDITCDATVVVPPVVQLPPPPVPDTCNIRGYSYEMPVGIFCTDLYQNGMFTIAGSVPANLRGVIDAVDVGKFNGERTVSGEFGRGLPICLEGQGRLFFLDASTSPRAQTELATFNVDGRTCGFIINSGTVVLIAP